MLDLAAFRPTADTAQAIDDAIAKITKALPDAQQRVDDALAKRDALLLRGGPKELDAAQAEIAAAHADVDQLTSLQGVLTEQLPRKRATEKADAQRRDEHAARQAVMTSNRAMQSKWETLAREMAALLEEQKAAALLRDASIQRRSRENDKLVLALLGELNMPAIAISSARVNGFWERGPAWKFAQIPATGDTSEFHWPKPPVAPPRAPAEPSRERPSPGPGRVEQRGNATVWNL